MLYTWHCYQVIVTRFIKICIILFAPEVNRGRLSRRTENFSGPKIHLSNMQNNFRMILEATHENFGSKTMTQNGPWEVLGSNKFWVYWETHVGTHHAASCWDTSRRQKLVFCSMENYFDNLFALGLRDATVWFWSLAQILCEAKRYTPLGGKVGF